MERRWSRGGVGWGAVFPEKRIEEIASTSRRGFGGLRRWIGSRRARNKE